jgi:hypothetical protein
MGAGDGQNIVNQDRYALHENDILETVLAKNNRQMMHQYGVNELTAHAHNKTIGTIHILKDQVETDKLAQSGMTSVYGGYSAGEMFAEAVADVYSHGSGAKDISKELVKEYETRQKNKVRQKYNDDKKPWYTRVADFFKDLFCPS